MRVRAILILSAILNVVSGARAQDPPPPPTPTPSAQPRTLQIQKAVSPIVVDAVLDDATWASVKPFDLPWETFPGDNIPAPVRTEVFLAYDRDNLYIAFHAYDPKPAEV